jgi:hypothetical protein
MPALRIALAAVLLMALAACSSQPLRSGPTQPALVTLPAHFAGSRVYLEVSINHAATAWMMLDTGETGCGIDLAYARSISLPLAQSSATIWGLGRGNDLAPQQQQFARLSSLQIGDLSFDPTDIQCATSDSGYTGQQDDHPPIVGVLGIAPFVATRLVLDIDYRHQVLHVATSAAYLQAQPGETIHTVPLAHTPDHGYLPTIPVAINGTPAQALVDIGNAFCDLGTTPQQADALGLTGAYTQAADGSSSGTFGSQASRSIRLEEGIPITIGDATLQAHTLAFTDMPPQFSVNLGVALFEDSRIVLDYQNSRFSLIR